MNHEKKICTCGRTKTPPYCDGGSHREITAETAGKKLCTCGRTKTPPYCDGGSHHESITKKREVQIAAGQSLKEREYWLDKFSGELVLSNFPYDFPLKGGNRRQFDSLEFELPDEISSKIIKLSNKSDRRLSMILTAGLVVLLAKYSSTSDIIVGTSVEDQGKEGNFINTVLALRSFTAPGMTFKELLLQVQKTMTEVADNQNYPFDALLDDLGMNEDNRTLPLFDAAIILENIHNKNYLQDVHFNILFSFLNTSDSIEGRVEYNTMIYRETTVERIVAHLKRLFARLSTDLNCVIDDVEILSAEEKRELLFDFNNSSGESPGALKYPEEKTIQVLFEEQVEKEPDNEAVVLEERRLTYGRLNEMANQLAGTIRSKGVKPNTIVGIMVERSIEMIVGMLGILKAGGAYLPLDPDYPGERLKYMIEDSEVNLLLTANIPDNRDEFPGETLALESSDCYQGEHANPGLVNKSSDSAYIIYTSGSTGKPKGVLVEHRSILNTLYWRKHYYRFDQTDSILQIPSFAFDSSVEDIFTPLLSGSKLVLFQEQDRLNLEKFSQLIRTHRVTHFLIIPNFYQTFLLEISQSLKDIKSVVVAGDHFTEELVKEHFEKLPGVKLYNEYGPAENSVCTTVYQFTPERTRVLIGKPIPNVRCYILDKKLNLLPIGVPGQLCVSGKGLARGYLKKPTLTAEKFVRNPYEPGERMYQTGDLARWLSDGNMEFLGRIDHQVKIRGVRIELGEIENQLLKHEDVKDVVVAAKERDGADKYLCAYLLMKDMDTELNTASMVEFLNASLPNFILPAYFVKMDRMPLTPSGKIDRKKLPEPVGDLVSSVEYVAPRNQIEETLAEIWANELDMEKVGIKDNYFNIGGDSIKSIKLINIINEKLNKKLIIADLYSNNTIEQLAEVVNEKEAEVSTVKYDKALGEIEEIKDKFLQAVEDENE